MKHAKPIYAALKRATPRGWIFDPDPGAGIVHAAPREWAALFALSCSEVPGGYVVELLNVDENATIESTLTAVGDAEAVEFWKEQIAEVRSMLR